MDRSDVRWRGGEEGKGGKRKGKGKGECIVLEW